MEVSRIPNSNCGCDLRTTDRNTAISRSSLINTVNGFPIFEGNSDNSTRKLCNILVPRYSLQCHYHMQLLHLENIFFWNRRDFLSLYHNLVDTIKIPLVREHQTGIPKPRNCSQSNSNERHPLTSLSQQRESESEKTTMHVLLLCKQQCHPGGAKLQIRINTPYTFAAQGRIIGG